METARRLIDATRQLADARTFAAIGAIVKGTARQLVAADGATFVLREGDTCHYLDEDAISPLWKGRRFPASSCVSGWVMRFRQQAIVPDISVDERIPQDAYRRPLSGAS